MKYIKIVPFILLIFSCAIPVNGIGNKNAYTKAIDKSDMLPIETVTNNLYSTDSAAFQEESITKTETNTITPQFTNTVLSTKTPTNQDNIVRESDLYSQLPAGLYIAYLVNNNNDNNEVHLMDISGKELGKWMEIGNGTDISISPNGEFILFSTFVFSVSNNLTIYNLLSKEQYIIPINNDDCYIKVLSEAIWSPDSNKIAAQYCGSGIGIIDINNGELVASFGSPVVNPDKNDNTPYIGSSGIPLWSPDGKWIAYFDFYYDANEDGGGGARVDTPHGPYVTDTSCIVNDATCIEKSHIVKILNNRGSYLMESILAWTPDNYLALLPADFESNIYI